MTRSHPPSLKTRVAACLERECGLRPGQSAPVGVVVAVSGGPDSLALCDVLGSLRETFGLDLLVASVDHGLRSEAAGEVRQVESFCARSGLAFRALRVEVLGDGGLQAAARRARYAALRQLRQESFGSDGLIATAHHQDDRAETVLLRLLRGVSLEGLGVLPARSGDLIRPMIRARRADVEVHCSRRGLEPSQDPSNRDPRFLRVRVRREVIPLLEELSSGTVASLTALADEACLLDQPLGLNREQRLQLRRALSEPRVPVDLPLPGGLRLVRSVPNAKS